jgi:adenosylcobinamide kinase/adenosylcobinamide-phosphate guanylyltransferase
MALTLLIGGARAGKSALAARLAALTNQPVSFIATAEAGDEEMAQRIARHRAERPASWLTIEEPIDLEVALGKAPETHVVIVDCLTLWVSNLMLAGRDEDEIAQLAEAAAVIAARREPQSFVVTNEVGTGVHPASDLGRRFRDLLGRVNSIWSREATEAFLVVAGRTIPLNLPSHS